MPSGVYPRTSEKCLEQIKKFTERVTSNPYAKGSIRTSEWRKAHSEAVKGKTLGEKNGKWKGQEVEYSALHGWVRRWKGRANHCEDCGLNKLPEGKKRYFQWANISHMYLRSLDDWKQLCYLCHKRYDSAHRKANKIIVRQQST